MLEHLGPHVEDEALADRDDGRRGGSHDLDLTKGTMESLEVVAVDTVRRGLRIHLRPHADLLSDRRRDAREVVDQHLLDALLRRV